MRAPSAEVRAGGKGIDAARVGKCLNRRSPLLVLISDLEHDQYCKFLVDEGPTIVQSEWDDYLTELQREIEPGEIIASMESFPHGVTEANVAELINIVHENKSLTFFDTAPHFMTWGSKL